jgi:outer membrane cobalamin receptor
MKKLVLATLVVAVAAPALAQGDKEKTRLAKLEEIVVTAEKSQPAGYQPDAKTAALLAVIDKSK